MVRCLYASIMADIFRWNINNSPKGILPMTCRFVFSKMKLNCGGATVFFSLKWRRAQEIWCFSSYRYLIESLSNPLSPNMWNSLGFQPALNRSNTKRIQLTINKQLWTKNSSVFFFFFFGSLIFCEQTGRTECIAEMYVMNGDRKGKNVSVIHRFRLNSMIIIEIAEQQQWRQQHQWNASKINGTFWCTFTICY